MPPSKKKAIVFKAKNAKWQFKPFGDSPISNAAGKKNGTYLVSSTYKCSGRKGYCHPVYAFAHGTIQGYSTKDGTKLIGRAKNTCANCIKRAFGVDNNVGNIITKDTVVKVGPSSEKNVEITVTNGSEEFLHDLTTPEKGKTKEHARLTLDYRQLMIREENGTKRPAADEEIFKSINRLKRKGLFCDNIGSRASSALSWPNALKLLSNEPVFNDLIKSIEEKGLVIVNGFCHAGIVGQGGVQDYHSDDFPPEATHRSVFQFSGGNTKKMMTMIHRREGRHVSFLTPHGSVVHLSREGAGADKSHELQHRLDGGEGTFALILETLKKKKKPSAKKRKSTTKAPASRKKTVKQVDFVVGQQVIVIGAPNPVPLTITSVKPPKGRTQGKVTVDEFDKIEFRFKEIEPYIKLHNI